MDTRSATLVRTVEHGESLAELINEAKTRTYFRCVEFALVKVQDGRRALISGGKDGITFEVDTSPFGHSRLFMWEDDTRVRVVRIYGHTHPRTTGPSDGDLRALALLGQTRSYLVEVGGPDPHGTLIRPKPRTPPA